MRALDLLPFTLLLLAACRSPAAPAAAGGERAVPPAPQILPWTDAFLGDALLVAETVRIEGPPGLTAHFVGRVEEGIATEVKTLSEGLRQIFVVEQPGRIEIRAQLDQLQIVAERRIEVLERPGPVDVTVEARGDVFHRDASGQERRAPSLRLVGSVRR